MLNTNFVETESILGGMEPGNASRWIISRTFHKAGFIYWLHKKLSTGFKYIPITRKSSVCSTERGSSTLTHTPYKSCPVPVIKKIKECSELFNCSVEQLSFSCKLSLCSDFTLGQIDGVIWFTKSTVYKLIY